MILKKKNQTLFDLGLGASAILGKPNNSEQIGRLQEMGLTEGARISLLRRAPFGGAIEVAIRGTRVCMRSDLAQFFPILSSQ